MLEPSLKLFAREIVLRQAWRLYGLPYKWGGNDPMEGFDCSGFVVELLQSVGLLALSSDYTASGLWELFKKYRVEKPGECCLAFWESSSSGRIVHVELCIGHGLTMGASGGGSQVTNEEEAILRDAYIKVRPLEPRLRHLRGYLDPFKKLLEEES